MKKSIAAVERRKLLGLSLSFVDDNKSKTDDLRPTTLRGRSFSLLPDKFGYLEKLGLNSPLNKSSEHLAAQKDKRGTKLLYLAATRCLRNQ
ncbi:hypothetical protein RRG08_034169 [Elysia crispata]|uniref:Uncharacterized protein n=1 Tax=Elysia crispata TaxID=231223 RepID=A0AAE0XT59_9GAST|nr:hypothetical protein RRG08_034169 [Elysia crispata]